MLEGQVLHAGMPSVTLSDVASARLQTISFFLLVLVLCAVAVHRIWNRLAQDFPKMPKISFKVAGGMVLLWGLLFNLVLLMISGARELLTPGAWEKKGHVYELKKEAP